MMRFTMLQATMLLALATASPIWAESGRKFASPEEAAAALMTALENNDDQALLAVFGEGSEDIVQRGSDPLVEASRRDIAAAGKRKLTIEGADQGRAVLEFGEDGWPSPIPLVRESDTWHFDVTAGREELLARRIGKNELLAISLSADYLDIQADYASVDRDGDGVREYAQRVMSTPGKQDGLYWEETAGGDPSPIGVALADALEPHAGAPYGGYLWKILTSQGASAPGGAYSYVINGNMIAGFALVGTPANYRKTGVMSFIVSNNGTLYQKDLGEQSVDIAKRMAAFDPDPSWVEVEEVTE